MLEVTSSVPLRNSSWRIKYMFGNKTGIEGIENLLSEYFGCPEGRHDGDGTKEVRSRNLAHPKEQGRSSLLVVVASLLRDTAGPDSVTQIHQIPASVSRTINSESDEACGH